MLTRRGFLQTVAALTAAPRDGSSDEARGFAHRIFTRINEIRVRNGSGELQWSAKVARCAHEQSLRKAELGFAGHNDPERGDVSQRLNSAGVTWSSCGENIFMERGWDDPVNYAVVFWWYSPGHQENLLKAGYTETGVGVAQAVDGAWFVTQIFVTPPPPSKIEPKRFRHPARL
jgi:uncharacterized protein YkwD